MISGNIFFTYFCVFFANNASYFFSVPPAVLLPGSLFLHDHHERRGGTPHEVRGKTILNYFVYGKYSSILDKFRRPFLYELAVLTSSFSSSFLPNFVWRHLLCCLDNFPPSQESLQLPIMTTIFITCNFGFFYVRVAIMFLPTPDAVPNILRGKCHD